ncbi:hypothetical protein [Dietzia sp. UBA5065]|jgi:hypothetical protein|uniref:hypothetical protein n=1 Tax=Dietzia sp. UBA5065 TaxID=1946422 RepID=UPI0025C00CC8|nr:hypothetical protein [Dietzia sp. UBA5065]HMT49421.1 hypothetical protein [Dietzia sp.]
MESFSGQASDYDPRDALADVAASRESVADRLITPWWYHPILGAIMAAIVAANALALPNGAVIVVTLLGATGLGALVGAYRRATGLWVDLRSAGPASRRWWILYAVVLGATMGAALLATVADVSYPAWFAVTLAAVTLVATVVLGRRVDAALRDEIRSGTAPLPGPAR